MVKNTCTIKIVPYPHSLPITETDKRRVDSLLRASAGFIQHVSGKHGSLFDQDTIHVFKVALFGRNGKKEKKLIGIHKIDCPHDGFFLPAGGRLFISIDGGEKT